MQVSPKSSDATMESLSDSGMSQRVPKCARCRSHGINCELKGHKEKCPFKDCQCRSCLLVVERQKITATRVAHLRHQRKIDKQRNNGYYGTYAGLTEEEEFVLTRYVDGTEKKIKHRMTGYDYMDGPPYKVPAVRYNGYHDPKPYTAYYQPEPWEYHRGNRLSPCNQECCVPWKEHMLPETRFAVRKVYDEGQSEGKMGSGLVISPSARRQPFENRRPFSHHFHPYTRYTNPHQEPRLVGYESKGDGDSESKTSQIWIEHSKKHHDTEAEIEVDVVKIHQDEADDRGHDDEDSHVIKPETKRDQECIISEDDARHQSVTENRKEMKNDHHRISRQNNEDIGDGGVDRTKEIEEQRRKRDDFIRSKCGEVLSVMFPDFDGRLIKKIAERSNYDIQKSVEQLLEIKRQMRVGDTKSAFSAYKDRASPMSGRSPCQCCTGRPMPPTDMKPKYFEMRKRDWVEAGIHDGRLNERPSAKRAQLGV